MLKVSIYIYMIYLSKIWFWQFLKDSFHISGMIKNWIWAQQHWEWTKHNQTICIHLHCETYGFKTTKYKEPTHWWRAGDLVSGEIREICRLWSYLIVLTTIKLGWSKSESGNQSGEVLVKKGHSKQSISFFVQGFDLMLTKHRGFIIVSQSAFKFFPGLTT